MINAWTLLGFGANAAMIIMVAGWAIARRARNATCLEVAWSYGFAIVICLYAVIGTGDPVRKALVAGIVAASSLWFGSSLLFDLIRHHPVEGLRYLTLREQFPKRPWLMFFGFSQYRGALLTLLSAPFAIACSNPAPATNGWEIAGLALWLAAMAAAIITTFQSNRFRSFRINSDNGNGGLWRYLPHPDCLFEWLVWVAYFLFALGSPWGWVTLYCPLLMLHLLTPKFSQDFSR